MMRKVKIMRVNRGREGGKGEEAENEGEEE